jgi:hypothetical protein
VHAAGDSDFLNVGSKQSTAAVGVISSDPTTTPQLLTLDDCCQFSQALMALGY